MRKRNTFFFFSVKSPFLSSKSAENAEKYCVFTILEYAKTTKNSRKNVQKQAKKRELKNIAICKLKRLSSQKAIVVSIANQTQTTTTKYEIKQTRQTRYRAKAAMADTTLSESDEHRTQNHCGAKYKARASRFLHSVEKYESRNEHHKHDKRNDRD